MNYFKYLSFASIGCITLNGGTGKAESPVKPNILCILVDDLGYGDLSCQYAKDLKTPNIDHILNQGVKFSEFYANCPVCSPSRAALLTGRFPDMVGVPGVIRTVEKNSWGYLSPDAVLIPTMLKKAGYKTAIIGKWHLGLESPNTPTERGFDFFHGFLGDMMDDYYTHIRDGLNFMRKNQEVIDPKGHATDIFSDWAIEYINEQKNEKNPFFLYLAYNAPHYPVQPPKEWEEKVRKREQGISEKRGKLVAFIEHLDNGIGGVLNALEKNGQLENTLIVFTSDNGGQLLYEANNGPLRGGKGDMYEGGIKVPCGFYWKNTITPHTTSKFAMLSDLFPTFCEIAGVPIKHEIDGISILPTLLGKEQVTDDRYVYWVYRGESNSKGKAKYAARYNGYKILQNTPFDSMKFYKIGEDPYEKKSLDQNSDPNYQKLFKSLSDHINSSGSIPWKKPGSQ